MSSSTLAFALDQKTLDPIDQLALIIAADCCGESFTLGQYLEALIRHTCLSERERMETFNSLSKQELIFLLEAPHIGSPKYFILVVNDDK
jgi:hypothetical protein